MRGDRAERFVEHLRRLHEQGDRGALAALRRGLASPPGTEVETFPYVAPFLFGLSPAQEAPFFIVASLFGSHPEGRGSGSFGAALAAVRARRPSGQGSLDKRFMALLETSAEGLPYQLRQLVSLARGREVPVDWVQLLNDIGE
ncbi:type I-E CRISPR-associated protein Cse2/CasB, partial [Candidatus Fermentibacterales bacterium]|nr:type I-E CRISPR-associated protein Cse2/CasB [Candidatus Fermentibacterales bacterium]